MTQSSESLELATFTTIGENYIGTPKKRNNFCAICDSDTCRFLALIVISVLYFSLMRLRAKIISIFNYTGSNKEKKLMY